MENDRATEVKRTQKMSRGGVRMPAPDQTFGKLPPQALDLEEAVLGALMLESDALSTVADILKPESFYKEAHQRIFRAIISLFSESEPIDLLTVTAKLRSTGELTLVGGAAYVTELTTKVHSAANIEAHARIISQAAIKRELIRVSSDILREAYEDTTDVFHLLDRTEQALFQISESNIRKNYVDMASLLNMTIKELEIRQNQPDGLTGVPSGFSELDHLTSGWQPSELIILAARPGMGKTAFVLSAMRNAAVDYRKGVAIFSLEMSAVQLMNRLISAEAEIGGEKIKKGALAPHEWQQLHSRINALANAPIFIDDTPALSILELRAKCRRLKAQHDIQMVIVDYLQLMTADTGGRGGGNREQEIAIISRSLKGLAKELNVPVIALSQLSRAVETRGGDKKPQLSDLRESGSIEQDADMVIFLYRPEYYGISQDEAGNSTLGVGEVIVAKNRAGSLDTVKLRFIGRYTKFADLDSFYETSGETGFPAGDSIGNFEQGAATNTFRSRANDMGGFNISDPNGDPPF